jgi:hypothetical protein
MLDRREAAMQFVFANIRSCVVEFFGGDVELVSWGEPQDFWLAPEVEAQVKVWAEDVHASEVRGDFIGIPFESFVDKRLRCLGYLPFTGGVQ